MKFTDEQLEKLREAYASGALEVRLGNEKIVYKSNNEMMKAIRTIEHELGYSKPQKVRSITTTFGKGL